MDFKKHFKDFFGYDFSKLRNDAIWDLDFNTLHQIAYAKIKPESREEWHSLYFSKEHILERMKDWSNDNVFTMYKTLTKGNIIVDFPMQNISKESKVLDYGAGGGAFSFYLFLNGFTDTTLADLSTPAFKFLQYICKKEEMGIKFIDIVTEYDLKEMYDYVICSEMLEHCIEPVKVLQHIVDHMNVGAYMYLSTFFNDMNGLDPFHLKSNTKRFNHLQSHELYELYEKCGLKRCEADDNGVYKIFRRV